MESYEVTISRLYGTSKSITYGPIEFWYKDSAWSGICVDKIKQVIAKQGWYKKIYIDSVGSIITEIHIVREEECLV